MRRVSPGKGLDDRWNAILDHDEFIPLESL
jgi:hypothetical protein